MATQRFVTCSGCATVPPPSATLLEELTQIANGGRHCSDCRAPLRLRLIFDFALGAQGKECTVLAAFYPKKRVAEWDQEEGRVEFRPFLVITEGDDGARAVWLPYWHLTPGRPRPTKYGQFSPCMDLDLFGDLLHQARAAGYLAST